MGNEPSVHQLGMGVKRRKNVQNTSNAFSGLETVQILEIISQIWGQQITDEKKQKDANIGNPYYIYASFRSGGGRISCISSPFRKIS